MIKAECHTDDLVYQVEFDAFPWLRQAKEEEILALIKCGYRGDYPADDVALFCKDHDTELAKLFEYLDKINEVNRKVTGFEVSVDPEGVRMFVHLFNPNKAVLLKAIENN